jgi:hypothetical protein
MEEFTIVCVEDFETGTYTMAKNVTIKKGEKFSVRFDYMYQDDEDPSQDILETDYFIHDKLGYLPNVKQYFLRLDEFREFQIDQIL